MIFIKGVKVAGSSLEIYAATHLDDTAVVTPMSAQGADADSFGTLWRPRNWKNQHGLPDFYDHMPAIQIRHVIGLWLYESMFKFGIIRNPFEKIRSFYFMNWLVQGQSYTLDHAISACDSERSRLCDGDSLIVHRVLEFERLDAELVEIFSLHNIPFQGKLPIRARSKPRIIYSDAPIKFNQTQIDLIMEKFAFEFDIYRRRHVNFEPNPE